jgi:hypothetical protein
MELYPPWRAPAFAGATLLARCLPPTPRPIFPAGIGAAPLFMAPAFRAPPFLRAIVQPLPQND